MTPSKTECISSEPLAPTQEDKSSSSKRARSKKDKSLLPKRDPLDVFDRPKSSKHRRKQKKQMKKLPILEIGGLNRRSIVADFEGGHISSDGGLILLKQVDDYFKVSEKVASCFIDNRDPRYVEHTLDNLVSQRIYGLAQGYEDLNDHDQLRYDPMFGIVIGKLESNHSRCAPLGGKSTLNRLEKSYRRDESEEVNQRYVKTSVDPAKFEGVFLDIFLEKTTSPPSVLILDMDVTDDTTYGEQEQSAYNPHYHSTCYAPLYIFCGRSLLAARLRPSNVDPAAGALEELQRIIPRLREKWPEVKIIVRGDSAYSRDDIMTWCESLPKVEYVFAMGSNSRLNERSERIENNAQQDYVEHRIKVRETLNSHLTPDGINREELDQLVPPAVRYGCFPYKTLKSWSTERRIICKVTWGANGPRHHFVVTSFSSKDFSSRELHTKKYCPRGEMENRIKEQQLDLFSGRTSNHYFDDNQLRLWFSSCGYVLLNLLREELLKKTKLANARVGTIRTHLLKVGTLIRVTVRRIHLAMHSSFPNRDIFCLAYQRLRAMANAPG